MPHWFLAITIFLRVWCSVRFLSSSWMSRFLGEIWKRSGRRRKKQVGCSRRKMMGTRVTWNGRHVIRGRRAEFSTLSMGLRARVEATSVRMRGSVTVLNRSNLSTWSITSKWRRIEWGGCVTAVLIISRCLMYNSGIGSFCVSDWLIWISDWWLFGWSIPPRLSIITIATSVLVMVTSSFWSRWCRRKLRCRRKSDALHRRWGWGGWL